MTFTEARIQESPAVTPDTRARRFLPIGSRIAFAQSVFKLVPEIGSEMITGIRAQQTPEDVGLGNIPIDSRERYLYELGLQVNKLETEGSRADSGELERSAQGAIILAERLAQASLDYTLRKTAETEREAKRSALIGAYNRGARRGVKPDEAPMQ